MTYHASPFKRPAYLRKRGVSCLATENAIALIFAVDNCDGTAAAYGERIKQNKNGIQRSVFQGKG